MGDSMARPQKWRHIFNEETLVPISLVVTIISAAVWISTIANESIHNHADAEKLAEHIHDSDELLRDISTRISRIEGKLDALSEKNH